MQYQQLRVGNVVIEFHNNWLGVETVIVNGQVVSKKSSVWGIDHHFSLLEDGHNVTYVVTSKVTAEMTVMLDLRRNGELVHHNVKLNFNIGGGAPKNYAKTKGLKLLNEYDLEAALEQFQQALAKMPNDPEIYFHMACTFSIMENIEEAYDNIKKAIENNLTDREMIFNHDMLAFLRMHDGFQSFVDSGFLEIPKL